MAIKKNIPLLIKLFFAIEILLGLAYIVIHVFPVYPTLFLFLDLDGEVNIPTWFSSAQLLMVGVLMMVFVIGKYQQNERAYTMLLGSLGFTFLSLDEFVQLHELFGAICDILLRDRKETIFQKTGFWMVFLAPIFLGLFWVWWRSMKYYLVGFAGKGKLLMGMLVFVGGATVVEIFSNFAQGNLMVVGVLVEELGEMAGITLFLWGVYELCISHKISIDFTYSAGDKKYLFQDRTVRDSPLCVKPKSTS